MYFDLKYKNKAKQKLNRYFDHSLVNLKRQLLKQQNVKLL